MFDSGDPTKRRKRLLEPVLEVRIAAKSKTTTRIDRTSKIRPSGSRTTRRKGRRRFQEPVRSEKAEKAAENDSATFRTKRSTGGFMDAHVRIRYRAADADARDANMSTSEPKGARRSTRSPQDHQWRVPWIPFEILTKIKSSDLTVTASERTILFDPPAGSIFESVSKIRIEGDMKTEINAMELPAKLDLTIENKTTLQP